MGAPNANTFDLVPPRRPGLDDFNGAVKEDEPDPPDPITMPSAGEYNTLCRLAVAVGACVPHTLLTIAFGGGVPMIASFVSACSNVTLNTFAVAHPAPGETTITWPPDTFPAAVVDPTLTINESIGINSFCVALIPNGIHVTTMRGLQGIDARFTVGIY